MGAKLSKTAAAVLERMRRNPEVAFYPPAASETRKMLAGWFHPA